MRMRRGSGTVAFGDNFLIQQLKHEHHRGARRAVASCTCGERTNRDSESSDKLEYDLSHRVPPFCGGPHLLCNRYAVPSL